MTSFNTFPKWHDNTGGAPGGQLRRAIMEGHSDYISGRPLLLLDRDSAGILPLSRATSQALRFNSACLGLYHLNAQLHVSRQAVRNALNHLYRLSNSGSSVALNNGRNGSQINGKAGQKGRF